MEVLFLDTAFDQAGIFIIGIGFGLLLHEFREKSHSVYTLRHIFMTVLAAAALLAVIIGLWN